MKALLLLLLPLVAHAQYEGPGVEVCRQYAQRQLMRDASTARNVVIERDPSLVIERYTRKVGNQFVSSILTGNGAVVFANAPSAELAFICLLADDKRAVFFNWFPRRDAPSLAQCRRGGGSAGDCLESLLTIAEQELTALYATHSVEAREADAKAGNQNASTTFQRSIDSWRAYRDAECARRAAGDERKACMLDLTRRRALDLR